jgi:hypothetical protein
LGRTSPLLLLTAPVLASVAPEVVGFDESLALAVLALPVLAVVAVVAVVAAVAPEALVIMPALVELALSPQAARRTSAVSGARARVGMTRHHGLAHALASKVS